MSLTFVLLCMAAGALIGLSTGYHALGTDRIGNDVLWQALKSIRTALVIGSLTTLAMLPPAIVFGISAGYFRARSTTPSSTCTPPSPRFRACCWWRPAR